jgi:hypothetical protein
MIWPKTFFDTGRLSGLFLAADQGRLLSGNENRTSIPASRRKVSKSARQPNTFVVVGIRWMPVVAVRGSTVVGVVVERPATQNTGHCDRSPSGTVAESQEDVEALQKKFDGCAVKERKGKREKVIRPSPTEHLRC